MEDLPLGRIAAFVPEFAVKDLPLGQNTDDEWWYINKFVKGMFLYINYLCDILRFLSTFYKTTDKATENILFPPFQQERIRHNSGMWFWWIAYNDPSSFQLWCLFVCFFVCLCVLFVYLLSHLLKTVGWSLIKLRIRNLPSPG